MMKRMLIDSTQDEETRVVVINGNKLEDVEFETSHRKQIKGNIYLGKVMRVEPSLQACFVDYGGNKHGFLAFGEIHPDYYNVSEEELAAIEKEADEIIEAKKLAIKEREAERERIREEKARAYAEREARRAEEQAATEAAKQAEEQEVPAQNENADENNGISAETAATDENTTVEAKEKTSAKTSGRAKKYAAEKVTVPVEKDEGITETGETLKEETAETGAADAVESETTEEVKGENDKRHPIKKRVAKKRIRKKKEAEEELKVLKEDTGIVEEKLTEEAECVGESGDDDFDDDDDDEQEIDFELQKKLLKARKLFHRNHIQDVIKEGQTLLIQVVKEERGNKGAALTTYLSLAGRYCVLMPNRIKSGGVSRKITNVADRKRLKGIVKELPLNTDMSLIVRTAGEEKTKADIVRDYNYLIRMWNLIRLSSLRNKAPMLIHEEGNLIKRALRDIYTKEVSEIIVAGDEGYRTAKDFFRILSPHNLKKIKPYKTNDIPLFQRFQVEGQLDKLHEANAQLESGGYLVINPTEALVAIDVNSGRATKEKDLEETALKTNLEACDEIAKQLRMRNLAGLVVIDFIDMEEPANNHAVEKRMKEALKKDRSRVQVGKMSCFGLLEISRQRMHSSFMESNYQVCPHCHGQGMVRTTESGAVLVLRGIEEEGIRNRSSRLNVFVPSEIAIYLLNTKRQTLLTLEHKYKMSIIISADDSIQHISDYRIERVKNAKADEEQPKSAVEKEALEITEEENKIQADAAEENETSQTSEENENGGRNNRSRFRKDRRNRRGRDRRHNNRNREENESAGEVSAEHDKKSEAVILYSSHDDNTSEETSDETKTKKGKTTWWQKLIKS